MARYFFDVVNERGRTHDYQGYDFPSLDGARRQGELIALDMQVDQEVDGAKGASCGKISVCDPFGKELFAIAVQGHQAFGTA